MLVFRINLLMLATFVAATGLYLAAMAPLVPAANWWAVFTAYAAYSGYAAVRLALVATGRLPQTALAGRNLLLDDRSVWLVNVPIVAALWLLHAGGHDTLLLVYIILSMTATSGLMISTVTRPPGRRLVWASPSVIPVSNALFVSVHASPYWLVIALINLSACASFLLAKSQLQGVLEAAWRAKVEAEAARDGRTRFLASASHDLGQPLQAARLFFDQAMTNPAGPARDAAVRGVNWAFDTTEALLGAMLEHLRLESGQVPVNIETVALGPVVATLAEMHEPAARLAGVDIIAVPTQLVVRGDRALIDRALGNLVVNALRHSGGKRVLVGARWTAGRVRVWVIDDGVGIPEIDMPRLFDDHFQGSNHGDEVRGGFGLGLASTRRLAVLMHGAAGLDRRWTGGSAFWLELPAA